MWLHWVKRADRHAIALGILLACWSCAFALNPTLEMSQYAHTAWKVSEGFSKGVIRSIAQTRDGYLWLGTEFGLLRFDGVRAVPWPPPAGEHLPNDDIRSLLGARDGRLWIGTFTGLASWKDGKLTRYPELDGQIVEALLEDREGTVWVAGWSPAVGRLCSIQSGNTQCYGEDGRFGSGVTALYEDSGGNLWVGVMNGLWRWKPGVPKLYPLPDPVHKIYSLTESDDGGILVAKTSGITKLRNGKVEPYPLPAGLNFQPYKLLRDRDGALWIGAVVDKGLLHIQDGRTDLFNRADGLSGDSVSSLVEDREGNIWVGTVDGLDRFREFAVAKISVQQGLSSRGVSSILAARDGSVWVGASDGLDRWNKGQITVYRKRSPTRGGSPASRDIARTPAIREVIDSGLPDVMAEALFEDDRGQIWVGTQSGVAVFKSDRFFPIDSVPRGVVFSIVADNAANVWISHQEGLLHLVDERVAERIPWAKLGRREPATALLHDAVQDGLWLGFRDGGVAYFKDGQLRASYAGAEGLAGGYVHGFYVDRNGTLWAAAEGGLSAIKDGRVLTLTSQNGLPCNTVHWMMEDDAHSVWLYLACGLVHIAPSELEGWAAHPTQPIRTTVYDSSDGVSNHRFTGGYNAIVAKSADGRLWFLALGGISIVDPRRISFNNLPPPVHIEQITADDKTYDAKNGIRVRPPVRSLAIAFTALSLVAPEKVRFRYKLEGQNKNWHEVVNERGVQYTNLGPGTYTFRVTACNNSGVWNEEGASLEFVVPPMWYQTKWFYALCAAAFLALLWAAYRLRVRQLQRDFKKLRDVIETIPAMAWTALPNGSNEFVNRRWAEYTGLSAEDTAGSGWMSALHPEDLEGYREKYHAAIAAGEPFESEARFRCAVNGEYRWLLARGVPLRDKNGLIRRWYGLLTDIEDRKRAEEELRRSNRELRAISNCNQTLLRATDEQGLLDEICRIVCDEAGYSMAWVGYAEHDEAKSVRPVAWTGVEEAYLTKLGITWADTEHGLGPTGTAIRTGRTCCIQDFATDPGLAPWRESGLLRDFRSATALPLKDERANPFGSLSIYSTQPNAFTLEESRLLEELVGDLAFGIVTLRSRAARRRAEQALRESEANLNRAQQVAHIGSWHLDIATSRLTWSDEVFRIFGVPFGKPLTYEAFLDMVHPGDRESVRNAWSAALHGAPYDIEHRIIVDGVLKWVREQAQIEFSNGNATSGIGTVQDITERKHAEEARDRLRQLEADLAHINRVSMMGELAASIAHEVNQPISGVVSNASACLRWLARDVPDLEEVREAARRIVRDGKRAGEVIARIRALTKRTTAPTEKLDPNEIIREVLVLVGDEAKKRNVIVRTEFAADLARVAGDRVQLQQVVLNLVINAIEAMSSVADRARELMIITRNVEPDHVHVTVQDSGVGIEPEKMNKIFDSFYTTKPGGMGMGLSISRSILEIHGGRLWAAAKDGPGTSVHFTLPKYKEEEANAGVASR